MQVKCAERALGVPLAPVCTAITDAAAATSFAAAQLHAIGPHATLLEAAVRVARAARAAPAGVSSRLPSFDALAAWVQPVQVGILTPPDPIGPLVVLPSQ
jgi:hypothetical protein